MSSLNGGPHPTTVRSSTAHRPQANDVKFWQSLPKLAFLAEATVECEIRDEREAAAALQEQRDVSLTSQDRIIVRDNEPPTNVSDAENERSDEGDLDDVSSDDEDDEDDIGHYDEAELEVVITRLARYGPSIIVEKTVQKHQSMAALVDACPVSKRPGIYPRRSVKGLPQPVILGLSTPGMNAHWSGVEMEVDPPKPETTRKIPFRRGVRGRPRKIKSESTDRDGPTVRGRSNHRSAAEGGGSSSSHLWLGRMKGQTHASSSLLGGETRAHGGNIITMTMMPTSATTTGSKRNAAKGTAADEKSSGQRSKASPVVNNVVSKGGKASGSSLLGASVGGVDDVTVIAKNHQNSGEVRLQQARQLLWAQKLHSTASKTDPEDTETPQNLNISTNATATPICASTKTQGDVAITATYSSDHRDNQLPQRLLAARGETKYRKMNADGICRVNLTVNWKARTRSRSDRQPPSIKSVTVDVHPGEISARFISRMVQMPPGGKYNDTQLNWGSFVLQPTQVMEEFYDGSWLLNLRSDPPPELVLVLPVGSLLVHPALCEAAGWQFSTLSGPAPDGSVSVANITTQVKSPKEDIAMEPVKRGRKRSKHDNLLIDGWVPTKKAVKAAAAAGHHEGMETYNVSSGDVEDKELKELSNRALHPGRTDPECMSKMLREYEVVVDNQPCSIVDVGSGDGHFVNGLMKTFPQIDVCVDIFLYPEACLCGIECQRHLYEESIKLVGRNANFILGTAETKLAECLTASVIIATTHNFDVSTIVSMVRCAARLPQVTHLVLGESRLCTPRCKAICGPCCCFEPLGTENIPTYWGNSFLSFTVYRRVVPWLLDADEVPRVTDEATLTALNSGELDAHVREFEPGFTNVLAACTKSGVTHGVGSGARTAAATAEDVIASAELAGGEGTGISEKRVVGGVEGGKDQPLLCSSEVVRMATAKLQRSVVPPGKFNDHDMKVRRHNYPRDRRTKGAGNVGNERADDKLEVKVGEEEEEQAVPGDGQESEAADSSNNKSDKSGIVQRLLRSVIRAQIRNKFVQL